MTQVNQQTDQNSNDWRQRARYFNSGNAFALSLPPVPSVQFTDERDLAFADATPTGLISMDLSAELQTAFPATTPFAMSRYMRLLGNESLTPQLNASVQVICILKGSGRTTQSDTGSSIQWQTGDVMLLPGNQSFEHTAHEDTVAWLVTDEPVLAFLGLSAESSKLAVPDPIFYPVADLNRELETVYAHPDAKEFAGFAVVLSHDKLESTRNIHPTLTLALNSLPSQSAQRPHIHNSMALTMCIDGEQCYTMIDGNRKNWQQHAVMVTPPGAVHSHHNDGEARMRCLIVQDGALYYHGRTMGFAFASHPEAAT